MQSMLTKARLAMMDKTSISDLAKSNNKKRFTKSVKIYAASLGIGFLTGIAMALHQRGIINLSTNTLLIITALLTVRLFVCFNFCLVQIYG